MVQSLILRDWNKDGLVRFATFKLRKGLIEDTCKCAYSVRMLQMILIPIVDHFADKTIFQR